MHQEAILFRYFNYEMSQIRLDRHTAMVIAVTSLLSLLNTIFSLKSACDEHCSFFRFAVVRGIRGRLIKLMKGEEREEANEKYL